MTKPVGWRDDPARHSLAAKGVHTKPRSFSYRTVKVKVPKGVSDFTALGYNQAFAVEDTGTVADWITEGLRHDPTSEDYQRLGEMVAEETITGHSSSDLEEALRYYEETPKYRVMRKAWARGYAQYVHEIVRESKKKYVDFPWNLQHKGG